MTKYICHQKKQEKFFVVLNDKGTTNGVSDCSGTRPFMPYFALVLGLRRGYMAREMILVPVLSDIYTAANPYIREALDVIEETSQSCCSPGLAHQATVQSN